MKLSLMHEEQNKTVVDEFHWKVLTGQKFSSGDRGDPGRRV